MKEKTKIAIVYTGFGEGGISSSLAALLKEISKNECLDITLYLFINSTYSRFKIPKNIKIVYPSRILHLWFIDKSQCGLIDWIFWYAIHFIGSRISMKPIEYMGLKKRYYENYDIAISFVNDINAPVYINFFANDFVLKCLNARKKIAWSHNDPYKLGYTIEYIRNRYKNFDTVVNVSNVCKEKFDKIMPSYKWKSRVAHNCIYEAGKVISVKEKLHRDGLFHLISVCRIDNKQKRIDRAIDTCVYLKKMGYADKIMWHLYGSGSDEKKLKEYAKQCGVDNIFIFAGKTNTPLKKMAESDVFVMTSDYEACSMTLLESQVANTPVIVTDFPEARESIQNGKNGFVVEMSPELLGKKIIELIDNPHLLEKIRLYIKEHPVTNERALQEFYNAIAK